MIKFLCATCGERLSVPDQFSGRKGVCPSCQTVNRVPLKGFAETHPHAPTTARPADNPFVPQTQPTAVPVRQEIPRIAEPPPPPEFDPAWMPAPAPPSVPPAASGDEDRPTKTFEPLTAPPLIEVRQPDLSSEPFHNAPEIFQPGSLSQQVADFASDDAPITLYTPRPWPRSVKISLLLLAALVIVGVVYSALYFAVHAMLP